jgi:aminomethyltransferase
MSAAIEDAYRSAFEAALIVRHETPGVIELKGTDRVDLLHRLSTNDLEGTPANRVLITVFTDPVGRTIDVVTVLTLSDSLLLVTSAGRSQVMQDWLQRHIFFQDDVAVHVFEDDWFLLGAYGPEAGDHLPMAAPPPGALAATDQGIFWPIDRPVAGYMRLVSPDQTTDDWSAGENEAEAFEILRIEAGLPKMGAEIQDDSIPLEVGLWDAVSFEKGCYVGQEIIARMESRGKLAKQLMGVRLEIDAKPGDILRQETKSVGTLTSVAYSPRFGWIGLASGRPSALAEAEGRVEIGETGEAAFVIELPFAGLKTPATA